MYFPILYAETHYRFKFLIPLYYKKEPEIITDAPKRVITLISPKIPILLIIKDADKFPVFINEVTVSISSGKSKLEIFKFPINKYIKQSYYSKIFYCEPKNSINKNLSIIVQIEYLANNKKRKTIQDNYFGLKKLPFYCYYTDQPLPYPKNWYAGDLHYHSNYTSDQVEFGADILSTKIIAKTMGLKWFFVTDHSYDLDDYQNDYLKNDPTLSKWKTMIDDTKKFSDNEFKIIFGEEISVGNSKNKNVHMLIINSEKFFHGSGDSAENWFHNKPEYHIEEIVVQNTNILYIAAHPFEKVPFIQKLLLNRDSWGKIDLLKTKYLQIINGNGNIFNLIDNWKKLLIAGVKCFILAGNDAHGNFNYMKQIKIPFFKLFISEKQTFGNWMTIFHYKVNNPINAILNGNFFVSNGPFINLILKAKYKSFTMGSTCNKGSYHVDIEYNSNSEFGDISYVNLFIGIIGKNEKKINLIDKITINRKSYIRAEIGTNKGFYAFTNPIWIL